jgi:hypothetical protein
LAPCGGLKKITSLPPRLAEAIREVECGDDGRPKRIRLHDKLQAVRVLMKDLYGLSDERPAEVNNTQVNIVTGVNDLPPRQTQPIPYPRYGQRSCASAPPPRPAASSAGYRGRARRTVVGSDAVCVRVGGARI